MIIIIFNLENVERYQKKKIWKKKAEMRFLRGYKVMDHTGKMSLFEQKWN